MVEIVNRDRDPLSISRYKNIDILKEEGEIFFETWKELEIPENERDKFHQVETSEKNRIDLIAYEYYDEPSLWWVIALANNIKNPFEVNVGDILRIPDLNTLYGYGGVLS